MTRACADDRLTATFPFYGSHRSREAWQASYESGGHRPWHRSPDITATTFAACLGYTDVTQVASRAVSGADPHIAVGIKLPNGTISTAAVIHLVLFGSGPYAPWEVVGTEDTTLTLDRPAYASTVPYAGRGRRHDHRIRREHPDHGVPPVGAGTRRLLVVAPHVRDHRAARL